MKIDTKDLETKQIYHLMIQTILPRPIAWVLTENHDKSLNLAPFSYFNGVSSSPPLIMISAGKKSDNTKKDTWINIEEQKHFVLHISSVGQENLVTNSAEELTYGDSEIKKLSIKTAPVEGWDLPKIKDAKVAYYCKHYKTIEIGERPQALILGEIQSFDINDEVISEKDGRFNIDEEKINPLARLGHSNYGKISLI